MRLALHFHYAEAIGKVMGFAGSSIKRIQGDTQCCMKWVKTEGVMQLWAGPRAVSIRNPHTPHKTRLNSTLFHASRRQPPLSVLKIEKKK